MPVRRDPRTGTVDVAVADALDAHAAEEIGFRLGMPVRVVRSPLAALEEGLARISAPRADGASLPPIARAIRAAPIVSIGPEPAEPSSLVSERPLPLVRRSSEPAPLADDIPIPLSSKLKIPRITATAPLPTDDDDEPVVELRRTKSSPVTAAVEPPPPPAAVSAPPESAPGSVQAYQVHQALRDMTKVEGRDGLMALVLAAVETTAAKCALFAVKKDAYVGWMCTPAFGIRDDLVSVRVDARVPSVFGTTAAAGAFVGPLLRNGPHAPLLPFVKGPHPEVVLVSIKAAGKPAVIALAYDVSDSRQAMVVMAEVARVAGEALERIVRTARGEPLSVRGGPVSRR
jgi:hypothetical protein